MQCDESAREKDRLAQENTKLQDAVRQLGKKNGELEAQVRCCVSTVKGGVFSSPISLEPVGGLCRIFCSLI